MGLQMVSGHRLTLIAAALLLAALLLAAGPAFAALSFDGSDDVVSHGDISALDDMTEGTWMFWLRYSVVASDGFLSKGIGTAAGNGWHIGTPVGSNNDISWRVANQSGRVVGAFPDATWHHWAFVFNGAGVGNAGRLKAYKDGVPVTLTFSGTIPATTGADNATHVLAMDGVGNANGIMGLVKIWNRALSPEQISFEALTYRPRFPDGLVLWAPYDDEALAHDYSGRGNHGTVTGAVPVIESPPAAAVRNQATSDCRSRAATHGAHRGPGARSSSTDWARHGSPKCVGQARSRHPQGSSVGSNALMPYQQATREREQTIKGVADIGGTIAGGIGGRRLEDYLKVAK